MLSAYRRYGLVIALALLAGAISMAVHPQAQAAALPSISGLTAGTEWHVAAAYAPNGVRTAFAYQEWQLRDTHGGQGLLYLAATTAVQKMLHWTGELGYQGAGYQVMSHRTSQVRLSDGSIVPINAVVVQQLADRELLAYAVVSSDGIVAHGYDDLWRIGWDTIRGSSGPYYLVRVSVPMTRPTGAATASEVATALLAPVLSALRADAHSTAL